MEILQKNKSPINLSNALLTKIKWISLLNGLSGSLIDFQASEFPRLGVSMKQI